MKKGNKKIMKCFGTTLTVFLMGVFFILGAGCSKKSSPSQETPSPSSRITQGNPSASKSVANANAPLTVQEKNPAAPLNTPVVKKDDTAFKILNNTSPQGSTGNQTVAGLQNEAYRSTSPSVSGESDYKYAPQDTPNPPLGHGSLYQAQSSDSSAQNTIAANPSAMNVLSNRSGSSASNDSLNVASFNAANTPLRTVEKPISALGGRKADLPPLRPLVATIDSGPPSDTNKEKQPKQDEEGQKTKKGSGGGSKGGDNSDGSSGGSGKGSGGSGGGGGGGGNSGGSSGGNSGGGSGGSSGHFDGKLNDATQVAAHPGGIMGSTPGGIPTADAPIYYRLTFEEAPLNDQDVVIVPTKALETLTVFPDALLKKFYPKEHEEGEYRPLNSGRVRIVYFNKVPDGLVISKFKDALMLFSGLVWGLDDWESRHFSFNAQYWDVEFDVSSQGTITQNLKLDGINISGKKGLFLFLVYAPVVNVEQGSGDGGNAAVMLSNKCVKLPEKTPGPDGSIQVSGKEEFECMLKSYEFARAIAFSPPPPPTHLPDWGVSKALKDLIQF